MTGAGPPAPGKGNVIDDNDLLDLISIDAEGAGMELPSALCSRAATLVGVSDVTIAVIGLPDRRVTLCASSERARTLDQWQFSLNQGPCLDATSSGKVTFGRTTAGESPWEELAVKARELGYGAIAGVPLMVGSVVYGAMNLQSDDGDIPIATLEQAVALAGATALRILTRVADAVSDESRPIDRAAIHQATGVVAFQLGISTDDALAVMRARAFTDDLLLEDLAAAVLDRGLRLDLP